MVLAECRAMPRTERRSDGDAGRSGHKIMKSQANHLREVRHGGFAAVALPVGVGRETDCGVERTDAGSPRSVLADLAAEYFAAAGSRK